MVGGNYASKRGGCGWSARQRDSDADTTADEVVWKLADSELVALLGEKKRGADAATDGKAGVEGKME